MFIAWVLSKDASSSVVIYFFVQYLSMYTVHLTENVISAEGTGFWKLFTFHSFSHDGGKSNDSSQGGADIYNVLVRKLYLLLDCSFVLSNVYSVQFFCVQWCFWVHWFQDCGVGFLLSRALFLISCVLISSKCPMMTTFMARLQVVFQIKIFYFFPYEYSTTFSARNFKLRWRFWVSFSQRGWQSLILFLF